MTIGELRERMTCREYMRWQIYDQVCPLGDKGDWQRTAELACMIRNVVAGLAGAKSTLRVDEIMQSFAPLFGAKRKKTGAEMESMMKMFARSMGAKVDG
jgi:hypothetical protein